jgi:hypothetical protein
LVVTPSLALLSARQACNSTVPRPTPGSVRALVPAASGVDSTQAPLLVRWRKCALPALLRSALSVISYAPSTGVLANVWLKSTRLPSHCSALASDSAAIG